MQLRELLAVIDKAYAKATHGDNGLVLAYHDNPHAEWGDSLARFLAVETQDTFEAKGDDADQLTVACHNLDGAIRELKKVSEALQDAILAVQGRD